MSHLHLGKCQASPHDAVSRARLQERCLLADPGVIKALAPLALLSPRTGEASSRHSRRRGSAREVRSVPGGFHREADALAEMQAAHCCRCVSRAKAAWGCRLCAPFATSIGDDRKEPSASVADPRQIAPLERQALPGFPAPFLRRRKWALTAGRWWICAGGTPGLA